MRTRLLFVALAALALAVAPDALAQSQRTDTEVIRSWDESVKTAAGTEARRVEVVFDYAEGTTLRRTYNAMGDLLSAVAVGGQPQPSPAEVAEAKALIAADAELGALIAERGASVEGGFVYTDEGFDRPLAACDAGARCLQFDLVAPSRTESVRFVVVDLATRRVVERDLFPNL